jgi:PPOX class probable F420-dependent enzyme
MHPRIPTGARTSLAQLVRWERELVQTERVGHLALADGDDRPRALPVTFAIAAGSLWSAIDRKPKRPRSEPARLAYLRRRPDATLTVDRYHDDWDRLAWVQVLGTVSILEASAAGEGMAALTEKYPQYVESPPPGPVLRLDPERIASWRARA